MTRSRKAQGRGEEDCNDKKQKSPRKRGRGLQ